MKTLFTFLIFIPIIVVAQAPNWFEPSSSWTYNHGVVSGPEHFQSTFGIAESVFADKTCAKMEPIESSSFGCFPIQPPYYFYESNDSIFYASEIDSTFRLAYNFNAMPNESWTFIVPSDVLDLADTFNVVVQNVNSILIDGITIKELLLEYTNISQNPIIEIYPQEITVLEYVGALSYFLVPFGQLGFCDDETNIQLQCFVSPSFGYVNPEFETCLVSVPTLEKHNSLHIYPNPASDVITLELKENSIGTIRIMQFDGKLVFSQSLSFAEARITLPSLSPGMYLVEVINPNGRYIQKLQIL